MPLNITFRIAIVRFYLLFISIVLSVAIEIQDAKKNVLFIAVDDLRPQLGCYGDILAKSPNIDALAAKSMVFERAYCQVAVCSPSRTSLLTGRRPDTNHVWRNDDDEYWRMFTNATTIPQYFKENGYRSIGMGKIFHLKAPSGYNDQLYSWSLPYYFKGESKLWSEKIISWHSFEDAADNDLIDGQIADFAIKTLKAIKQNWTEGDNTPFFLAAGFHKPHLPFYAPSKYYDLYPPADQIPLPRNPNAPIDMPPIAWSVSGELRSFWDMHKYRLPECRNNAEASIHGDSCHISDSDAHLLPSCLKLYRCSDRKSSG